MSEKIIIPIENISKDFEEHLLTENNNNILFSWKFWLWKTFFLKSFFDLNIKKYDSYYLFPVNYQISSNEDIINLLQYDILVELLSKDKNLFNDNKIEDFVDLRNMLYLFWNENKLEILKVFFSYIPKLWRPLKETINLVEKIWAFKDDIEKWEKWIYEDFMASIKSKNITENDNLSNLIFNKINFLKWDSKKSILILDDLDRIDPEHIFRIMNVFWAHFNIEHKSEKNKFWFDKVILVWDYNNLESIFHHKYWVSTDFDWYINKFYSSEIYFFDNSKIVESKIKDIIQSFKYWDEYFKWTLEKDIWYIEFILREILEKSVLLKTDRVLSIRELLKWTNSIISPLKKKKYGWYYSEELYLFHTSLEILISIFWCKKENLINVLIDIKENYIVPDDFYWESAYRKVIFVFINSMYKISNFKSKYNDYPFEEDFWKIGLWKIDNIKLINLFYEVLIDYIENKI